MAASSDMPDQSPDQLAAEWVIRRDRGLTPAEQREYLAWQESQIEAIVRLRRTEGVWRAMDAACRDASLVSEADALEARLSQQGRGSRRRFFSTSLLAAAAAIALSAYIGWRNFDRGPDPTYRVLASTAQVISLPDRSVARLNGDARIAIDYTDSERRVTLLRGEVHFEVAENPQRPFFVRAGDTIVRAVGTAFNVRMNEQNVEVIVTEGRVRIEDVRARAVLLSALEGAGGPVVEKSVVSAGERVLVPTQQVLEAKPVLVVPLVLHEVEQALAWQTTRLVFSETTLDQVVGAFNQHNVQRLVLGDEQLRERTLTGVFRADNLDGFVRLVQASIDVRAEVTGSGTIRLYALP